MFLWDGKKMRVLKKKKKANHFWQISIAMYGKYKNLKQIEKKKIIHIIHQAFTVIF